MKKEMDAEEVGDQQKGGEQTPRSGGTERKNGEGGVEKDRRRERRRWSREIKKAEELKRKKCRAAAPNLSMGLVFHNFIIHEGLRD